MFSEATVDMPHFEEVLGAFTKALRLPSTKDVLGFLPAARSVAAPSLCFVLPDTVLRAHWRLFLPSVLLAVSGRMALQLLTFLKHKGGAMTTHDQINQILRALGRIEGRLIEINSLSARLSLVEMSISWIKGGWAILVAAVFYLYRLAWGKP
jgi:hypothetical protein